MDPERYLRFAEFRHRAGLDLLNRVPDADIDSAVDLGCGAGALTLALASRLGRAGIAGIDRDPDMVARAVEADTERQVSWMVGDIATWTSAARVDLIFSNAAFNWVDDHAALIPRLMTQLSTNGILAFQVPANHDQPTHTSIRETVEDGPWSGRLAPLLRPTAVLEPQRYHALLRSSGGSVDIWQSTYLLALDGPDPVLEWTRGTILAPIVDALGPGEKDEFLAAHADRLRSHYPPDHDGTTLLPFTRTFVVAQRQ